MDYEFYPSTVPRALDVEVRFLQLREDYLKALSDFAVLQARYDALEVLYEDLKHRVDGLEE